MYRQDADECDCAISVRLNSGRYGVRRMEVDAGNTTDTTRRRFDDGD